MVDCVPTVEYLKPCWDYKVGFAMHLINNYIPYSTWYLLIHDYRD